MRRFLFIILLCLSGAGFAQETLDSVCSVVVDAGTGEPIPYVGIYVSSSCGTISNYNGEFCLQCRPSDELRISCIGYSRVSYKASELPGTIRLQPIASTLREITVMATDDILYRLVNKMQKEGRKHKKDVGRYFYRLTTMYPGTEELAEAFLTAKSCVQIRDIHLHSANRGLLTEGSIDAPDLKGLNRTDLHVFMRLAPILVYEDTWDFAVVPSDVVLSRKGKLLDVSCTSFTEDDGTEICKINVRGKPAGASYTILEGTLYVDRKKCQLLRFDGEVKGLYIKLYDFARSRTSIDLMQCSIHVDYRHDHGFTEIDNMSGTIVKDKVMMRYILFNLGGWEMNFTKDVYVGDDLIPAIDRVGYDSTLWAMTGIVKRTQAEERVAFQGINFRLPGKSNYNVPPSAREAGANMYLNDAMRQLKGDVMKLNRGLPPG